MNLSEFILNCAILGIDLYSYGSGGKPSTQIAYVASPNNLNWTYDNGSSGVGATLTAPSAGEYQIDSETLSVGDVVFLFNQTNETENGLYEVTVNDDTNPGILTRAKDYDTVEQINNTGLIVVQSGETYAGTSYYLDRKITEIGTSNINYNEYTPGVQSITTDGTLTASPSVGNVVLSLPQSIGTDSSPVFSGLNLSSLSASQAVVTNSLKQFTSLGYSSEVNANYLVQLDDNANLSGNNITLGYEVITTNEGLTTLTASSGRDQVCVGLSSHIIKMPDTSTLKINFQYLVINKSLGQISIVASDDSEIAVLSPKTYSLLICDSTSITSSDAWTALINFSEGGSVSAVGLTVPSSSIFGVTNSPITTSGDLVLTTTGISGGIPYFSSTSKLSSSGVLTANQLVLGGGAGSAPTSLSAGAQYQVLVMGESNPGYGAVNLSQSAAVTGILPNTNTTATSSNTASAIVSRDSSGNFSAGKITASLSGNSSTATSPESGSPHGAVTLDSSGEFQSVAPGASGNILTSNGADWVSSPPATSGTVTSVGLSVPATSIFGVTGSPITSSGTLGLKTTGNSGGIPYFSSSSVISSSGALTANQIVLGGGEGSAPTTLASGTQYQVLVMGASSPEYGAINLDQSSAVTGILSNANTTATSANTSSSIVSRDTSGDFSAGTITASLSGNASTATSPEVGSAHGAVTLNSSGEFQSVAPGISGNVLMSDGTDWISSTVPSISVDPSLAYSSSGAPLDFVNTTSCGAAPTSGVSFSYDNATYVAVAQTTDETIQVYSVGSGGIYTPVGSPTSSTARYMSLFYWNGVPFIAAACQSTSEVEVLYFNPSTLSFVQYVPLVSVSDTLFGVTSFLFNGVPYIAVGGFSHSNIYIYTLDESALTLSQTVSSPVTTIENISSYIVEGIPFIAIAGLNIGFLYYSSGSFVAGSAITTSTLNLDTIIYGVGNKYYLASILSNSTLRYYVWNGSTFSFINSIATGSGPNSLINYVINGNTYLAVSCYSSNYISTYLWTGSSFVSDGNAPTNGSGPYDVISYQLSEGNDNTTYLMSPNSNSSNFASLYYNENKIISINSQLPLTILSNISSSVAIPSANSLSDILDASFGSYEGAIIGRGQDSWSLLAPGASGNVLTSNGSGWSSQAGGTVTSVGLSVPSDSIFGVTDSPVTSDGTLGLTTNGSSGGLLYFSDANTVASSSALTSDQLIIGGGAGSPPSTLDAGSQYQALVMGASSPEYGAINLDQSSAVTGILPNANTTATSSNTNNSIVSRDSSGNFSASTITANLTGHASQDQYLITSPTANNLVYVNSSGQTIDSGLSVSTDGAFINPTNNQIPTASAVYDFVTTALAGPITILGNWDASTNTPTLTAGVGTVNTGYYVSVAGTQTAPSGVSTNYDVGDLVYYGDNLIWNDVSQGLRVVSLNGQSGVISNFGIPDLSDVTLSALSDAQVLIYNTGSSSWTNQSFSGAFTIDNTGLATLSPVPNSLTTATSSNTNNAIVARDSSGNFSAGTITASLSGNASTATSPASGSAHGVVTLNSSSAFQSVAPGSSGNVLTSNGTDWVSLAPATSGTVTSVSLSVPSASIFGVTGSPITSSGTLGLTTTGTSGGIPYFSSSSVISSSGALTANQLVIGGGAGSAPSSLSAGSQYQVLVMGASNPAYGAVNLAQSAAVTGILPNANTTATSSNTASAIVSRDASGNFSAGTINGSKILAGTVTGTSYILDARSTVSDLSAPLHVNWDDSDNGLYISGQASNAYFYGGCAQNSAGTLIAKNSDAFRLLIGGAANDSGGFTYSENTGLTAGNSFTPTARWQISYNGAFRTAKSVSSTIFLSAYDTTNSTYRTVFTATGGTTPSFVFSKPTNSTFTIDGADIGGTTAGTGAFSTLSASSTFTLSALTANGVLTLNASKQAQSVAPGTSGNILTSNGTSWVSSAPATSGTVTSVALSVPATSIFGVTGSPITTSGTLSLTTTGTSGGIPYFSSSSVISSSSALTANQLILGGGAGSAPTTLAAGTQYQVLVMGASDPGYGAIDLSQSAAVTGILANANTTATNLNTASAIVSRDSSGNFSAGTITANLTGTASLATNIAGGSANNIVYQTASNTTGFLSASANQILASNGSSVPGFTSTLPSAVQSNITSLGTVTSGIWNGTKIGLAYGGTDADLSATGGASQVLKQTTVGGSITVGQLAASDLSNGTTGSTSVVLASSPTISSPTLSGTITTGLTARGVATLNGSSEFTTVAPGSSGNVLTSNGTDWVSSAPSSGGTVTSVAFSVPATSIFGVTGSPITTSGTLDLTTTGTSGGIPYFSSSSVISSSAALTANQLVLGGGVGSAPTSLAAGTQYQVLVMGASNPSYGALNLAQSAAVTGILPNANTTATSANTASAIVSRDSNGDFSANSINFNSVKSAVSVSSYSATITPNFSTSSNIRITLTGNATLGVPTNLSEGQQGVINVWQDISGSRSLSYAWCYTFPNSTAPTLSQGKLNRDSLSYFVDSYSTSTVTISIATPGVVTWNNHNLTSGQVIQFTTTGSLPTGLSTATSYWITVIDSNSFYVSTSLTNASNSVYVSTSGSQSGTQTATQITISIYANLGMG